MKIDKTGRDTLKAYFVKNAVPTASNFEDLINAGLNQREDGIAKLSGEPLSIQADSGSTLKVLNFYKDFNLARPTWTLSLNPRVDPANNASPVVAGWSLGDGNGNSKLFIDEATGNLGIETATPRTGLDTGTGVMSGAANDYQKAQFTLSGGGTVTWGGPNGYLKWTNRFIAISMERAKTFLSGYVDIILPTSAAALTAWDGTARLDPQRGILLKDWEALYAIHEVGKDNSQVRFQIVVYSTGTFHAPSNWLLVAVVNSDDGTVKLGSGVTVARSSSYAAAQGSGLPRGAIIMWSGATAPDGWALCEGQNGTPDLRGRFVLAAGAGNGLTRRTIAAVGGQESHVLTKDEMPVHDHGVGDPGHYHTWSGSRQQAGTDDHNNTYEFSKGDAGAGDTVVKNTDFKGTGIAIAPTGGSAAHENMPPFYVLAFIMKL